jgi:hypothetical protein
MMRIAAFLCGAYWFITGLMGCIAMKCDKCFCTFCYGCLVSVGVIFSFILGIVFLAFAGLDPEMIEKIC